MKQKKRKRERKFLIVLLMKIRKYNNFKLNYYNQILHSNQITCKNSKKMIL